MTFPSDPMRADYSNQAVCNGTFSPVTTVAGVLIGLFTGPGLAVASPNWRNWKASETQEFAAKVPLHLEISFMVAPAADLISRIKTGWSLNMTELAELMGVQRPTLYNWVKGKTSPDPKSQKHLQGLAAAAADWKEATAGSNWDFLLDYSGPKADALTIREILSRADVSPGEIRDLIQSRMKQYREAYARSREILGEPTPITGEPIRESTRKLNKRWTEHAQKLHRASNASL